MANPTRSFILPVACSLLLLPAGAGAGENEPYVFATVGLNAVKPADITDHDVSDDLVFHDLESDHVIEYGGGFGFWRLRAASRLDWGLRADIHHSSPDQPAQTVRATGRIEGLQFAGDFDLAAASVGMTTLAASVLVRFHAGHFTPYLGAGGGLEWLRIELDGGARDRDGSTLLQGIAGLEIAVTPRLSLAYEYRYTQASHEFVFGTAHDSSKQRSHHFSGSLVLHL